MTACASTTSVSCGACGAVHAVDAWADLPSLSTLTTADVERHLVDWPSDAVIEVRACPRCGAPMARKRGAGRAR